MSDISADLRSYYEEEARRGLRKELVGRRVSMRTEYIEQLHKESRTSVIDFGAGPGGDVEGFVGAGLRCVGLDLAHGNGVLAATRGLAVIQASIDAPPIKPASFQAGWSMSTLMHIPEVAVPATLSAMAAVLEPGAPLFVGLWGGGQGDQIDVDAIEGEQRLFSLRSFDRNRELLQTVGQMERSEAWPVRSGAWDYHLFVVRVPHAETTAPC